MDEQLYPVSRAKALLTLVGAAAFVVLAAKLEPRSPLLAWLGGGFFALCAVASASALIFNVFYVRLTPRGLELSQFLKRHHCAWSEVGYFSVQRLSGSKLIRVASRAEERPSIWRSVFIANHYSIPIEALCDELNRWRERYGRNAD